MYDIIMMGCAEILPISFNKFSTSASRVQTGIIDDRRCRLKVVGNNFQNFPALSLWRINTNTLSDDTTIMVLNKCLIIGEKVMVVFATYIRLPR